MLGSVALVLASLWSGPAMARDPHRTKVDEGPATVFVSPFQAQNREAVGLAALLPGFLSQELGSHADLTAIPIEQVGAVHDTPADVYASTCPAGEFIGCAYVLGEAAQADYAIAGSVESLVTGTQVEIHIIDVSSAEDVLSFQVELGMGDDEVFAQGVARILVAVVHGEAGGGGDIRAPEEGVDAGTKAAANAAVAGQLDQLSREIGDVTTITRREGGHVDRPKVTIDDIVEESRSDARKAWERFDMKPKEYLRYRNSGYALHEWKKRAQGRKGQLVTRPYIGFGRGPVNGEYNGRYARDAQTLEVIETYAWQAVVGGSGVTLGGSVAYGLLPEIEVGLCAGVAWGRYSVQIHGITEGQTTSAPEPQDYASTNIYVGPQVLWVPLPTSTLRPVVGGRVEWWHGSAVDSHVRPPEGLDTFSAPNLGLVTGIVGGEVRMSERLDAFVHLPITAVIAGKSVSEAHEGDGALDITKTPPALATTGASLVVGIQLRFLGPKRASGLDAYEGIDE